MDFEAIESIATTGTVILSAIYAITSYKKNKALDSTCIAFEKFYAPAFFWLKKCMYQTDKMATEKFKVDMNEFRTIYIENNIYASAFVQVSFDKFDTSWNEWLNTLSVETTPQLSQQQDDLKREADKHFKSFCDNFITDYNTTIGKTSGDKYISTVLRNKNKWYSSRLNWFYSNFDLCLKLIPPILLITFGVVIALYSIMLIIAKILAMIFDFYIW